MAEAEQEHDDSEIKNSVKLSVISREKNVTKFISDLKIYGKNLKILKYHPNPN